MLTFKPVDEILYIKCLVPFKHLAVRTSAWSCLFNRILQIQCINSSFCEFLSLYTIRGKKVTLKKNMEIHEFCDIICRFVGCFETVLWLTLTTCLQISITGHGQL